MSTSPILLIGIGTAGCKTARGVNHAFGKDLRYVLADTDARTGEGGGPFILIGGNRLSGHGAGGDVVQARLAAEDSISILDDHLEGVRIAVIVTALGGGTGGGVTLETLIRLQSRGIPSIVFATTPFVFEGENRQRASRGILSMIEEQANAAVFLPLDKLVSGVDNFEEGMRRAIDTLATAITLFWRMIEKPGYIHLDTERLRHIITGAGRGRFAAVSTRGPNRAEEALDLLRRNELLATASGPIRTIICGVLAGSDLRLSEVGTIADGIQHTFSQGSTFHLSTVNDEATFSGRLSLVTLMFEANSQDDTQNSDQKRDGAKSRARARSPLSVGPTNRGRFNNVEATIWNGQNLDEPTFIRENISLEF